MNYEPSGTGGLAEAPKPVHEYEPAIRARLVRQKISRTDDYQQAGERYRSIEPWERDDLILNLVTALKQCDRPIQERMVGHFYRADADYGQRVADGLGLKLEDLPAAELAPVARAWGLEPVIDSASHQVGSAEKTGVSPACSLRERPQSIARSRWFSRG